MQFLKSPEGVMRVASQVYWSPTLPPLAGVAGLEVLLLSDFCFCLLDLAAEASSLLPTATYTVQSDPAATELPGRSCSICIALIQPG